jgi:cytochrome c
MKKLLFSLGILLISCKNENQENFIKSNTNGIPDKVSGKELFENKGNCIACHQTEQKVIGPSLSEIASTYKAKNRSIVLFLKEESEPIIDPSQYDIMKANFAITKNMSDDELKAIEDYIYTFSK